MAPHQSRRSHSPLPVLTRAPVNTDLFTGLRDTSVSLLGATLQIQLMFALHEAGQRRQRPAGRVNLPPLGDKRTGTKGRGTGLDWETMGKRNYWGWIWIWIWGTPMTFDFCGLFRLNVQQKPEETSKSFCNLQATNAKISSKVLNRKRTTRQKDSALI